MVPILLRLFAKTNRNTDYANKRSLKRSARLKTSRVSTRNLRESLLNEEDKWWQVEVGIRSGPKADKDQVLLQKLYVAAIQEINVQQQLRCRAFPSRAVAKS